MDLSKIFHGCELPLSYIISMFSLNLNDTIAFDHSNQYQTLSCRNLVQCWLHFSLPRRLLTLNISGLWALEIVNTSLLSLHLQTIISFYDLQIMSLFLTFSPITFLRLRLQSFLSVPVMYVPWFERHSVKETEL